MLAGRRFVPPLHARRTKPVYRAVSPCPLDEAPVYRTVSLCLPDEAGVPCRESVLALPQFARPSGREAG